ARAARRHTALAPHTPPLPTRCVVFAPPPPPAVPEGAQPVHGSAKQGPVHQLLTPPHRVLPVRAPRARPVAPPRGFHLHIARQTDRRPRGPGRRCVTTGIHHGRCLTARRYHDPSPPLIPSVS